MQDQTNSGTRKIPPVFLRVLIYVVVIALGWLVVTPDSFETLHLLANGTIPARDLIPDHVPRIDFTPRAASVPANAPVGKPSVAPKIAVPAASAPDAPSPNAKMRLLISFNSEGGGPDRETETRVTDYIDEQERQLGRRLQRRVVNWGREGEYTLCMPLAELDGEQQRQFIAALALVLGATTRARITTNAPCPTLRR